MIRLRCTQTNKQVFKVWKNWRISWATAMNVELLCIWNYVKSTWFAKKTPANPPQDGLLLHGDCDAAGYIFGVWIMGCWGIDVKFADPRKQNMRCLHSWKKCLERIFNLSGWRSGGKCIWEEEMMAQFSITYTCGSKKCGGDRKQQNGARHWAKKHTDGDRSRDRERRCRRRERELRRWERRRERQIERTGWEVLYPSSPSSKTLISSIDSQFFRSLAVKCSSHTHIWTHTHRGWCTHVQPSLPTHTDTHTHIHTHQTIMVERVMKYRVIHPRITLRFQLHK